MSNRGRKAMYDKEIHPTWAWSLAVQGLTDKEISAKMGISRTTLNKWKIEHEEFSYALNNGKEPSNASIEKTLFEKAKGYQYTERKIISSVDPRTGKPSIERIETYEKQALPDTTAMIFWLKNRQRNKWRDKWDVEIDNDKEITFNIVGAKDKKG